MIEKLDRHIKMDEINDRRLPKSFFFIAKDQG